ncbi:hypothetical protein [Flavobacterium sp.]|uniref:hypothetical protein n=1 Tax=Flavobacterium sp. TaxID=239 RepID=UPI00333E92A7
MHLRHLLLSFPLWVSCQNTPTTPVTVTKETPVTDTLLFPRASERSYLQQKKVVKDMRNALPAKASNKEISRVFTAIFVQHLIPHWVGTPWSFEGHPEQPGMQPVACSYFVATVLRDAGVVSNRYRMAQLGPEDEARYLSEKDPILTLSFSDVDSGKKILAEKIPEGIHFIGFGDLHVGFIYRKGNQMVFIHSYYKDKIGVIIDPVENSPLWEICRRFYVYPLSGNITFLNRWKTKKAA